MWDPLPLTNTQPKLLKPMPLNVSHVFCGRSEYILCFSLAAATCIAVTFVVLLSAIL